MIKPITGHEGYFADTEGNIYSSWNGKHGLRKDGEMKKLKGSSINNGHVYIRFGRKGPAKLVHRLIYQTFVGVIPEGLVVRHWNDNPKDNRVENLLIGTQKDNMQDCKRNGHFKSLKKLTDEQIEEIKVMRLTMSVREIAPKFNVAEKTVRNVINNYYKKGNDK